MGQQPFSLPWRPKTEHKQSCSYQCSVWRMGKWGQEPAVCCQNQSSDHGLHCGRRPYSEMRAGYEVTNDKKNWEIVMGGTHIMTPEEFLDYVKDVAGSGDDDE